MTDERLEALKQEYIDFGAPSWKDGVELIDEIKRLRSEIEHLKNASSVALRNTALEGENALLRLDLERITEVPDARD